VSAYRRERVDVVDAADAVDGVEDEAGSRFAVKHCLEFLVLLVLLPPLVAVWQAVGGSGFADGIGLLQDLVAHLG